MARNMVQFQKSLSMMEFVKKFGTEQACRDALFQLRWPGGFACPECGNSTYCELKSRAIYQCHRCHHQTSLTARTVFERTKLPLATWFLAIFLVTQSKTGLSALALSRHLGVSYNTAWRVKQKLMQTMRERGDSRPLTGPEPVEHPVGEQRLDQAVAVRTDGFGLSQTPLRVAHREGLMGRRQVVIDGAVLAGPVGAGMHGDQGELA